MDNFDELDKILNEYSKNEIEEEEINDIVEIDKIEDRDSRRCGRCKRKDTIVNSYRNGYEVCKGCGFVQNKFVDAQPEWRFYGVDDSRSSDPSRCGRPRNELLPQSSMKSHLITKGNSYKTKTQNWDWGVVKNKERSLKADFNEIKKICVANNLTKSIIDDAFINYHKAISCRYTTGDNKGKQKIIRAKVRQAVKASSVYHACKNRCEPRTPKEIAKMWGLTNKKFSIGNKRYKELVGDIFLEKTEQCNTEDFVNRFCDNLLLGPFYKDIAKVIVTKAEQEGIVNENPPSIVAGTLYLMSNLFKMMKLSKKEISEKCNISEVTIVRTYDKLSQHIEKLMVKEEKMKDLILKMKHTHLFQYEPKTYTLIKSMGVKNIKNVKKKITFIRGKSKNIKVFKIDSINVIRIKR
jgi:transcription initiation factor TFIIIB Brf1 subunit/transcription initiation factor TFIIB